MTSLIRATVISGIDEVIREAGGDPVPILRRRGIDPSSVGDFDRFVGYDNAAGVMGDAARQLSLPEIGLRLGGRQSVQILGPVGVIFRNSATVGEALDGVCRFIDKIAPMDAARLERSQHAAVFTYDAILANSFHRSLMVEKSLSVAMGAFRWILGDDFVPFSVSFDHRRLSDTSAYEEVFGGRVQFEAAANAIQLPLRTLEQPVPGRDRAALELAEHYLAGIRPGLTVGEHVAEVTRQLLVVDNGTLADVARALALHPRVLQRRLAGEGLTFESILDGVRRSMAWDLAASGIPAGQIARELGYAEQSSFSRACRRWYGITPRELSAQAR
jgi:AraC-like DNA-binding protein